MSRNTFRKVTLFLTAFAILLLAGTMIQPSAAAEETEEIILDVRQFGAVPDDSNDDADAINAALEQARVESERTEKAVTVYLPAGTYYTSDPLYVFSNTILKADKDTVVQAKHLNKSVVNGAHIDPATGKRCYGECSDHGFGYSKCKNITVTGGTWIAGNSDSSGNTACLTFRHSQNINIRNLTCKNASGHTINLSGVSNGKVIGVTVMDQKPDQMEPEKIYLRECVHLDYCTETGEPGSGMPYDGTPAVDIVIENCIFKNVYAGVGNHHPVPAKGKISSGITVRNCKFTDLHSFAVEERSVNGLTITGCTVKQTPVAFYTTSSSNINISGNTVDAESLAYPFLQQEEVKNFPEVYIEQCSDVIVDGNEIKNTKYGAIKAWTTVEGTTANRITVQNNTLTNIGDIGIDLWYGDGDVVSGNILKDIGNTAIQLSALTGAKVKDNQAFCETNHCLYIRGMSETEKACVVDVSGNSLDARNTEQYCDLYLSNLADCTISGNTLKNWTFHSVEDSKYTADFPKMTTIEMEQDVFTYTGEEIHPDFVVKDENGRELTLGKHYRVYYDHCENAGSDETAVRVTGLAHDMYEDQVVEKHFTINPLKVTPKVTLKPKSAKYNGKQQKPAVKVTVNGVEIEQRGNYSVKYNGSFKNANKYSISVELKGNYRGRKTVYFNITKATQKPEITKQSPLKISYRKLQQSKQKYERSKFFTVKKATGSFTYTLTSKDKKVKNYISIHSTSGKVTVARNTPKGTYVFDVKIKIKDKNYKDFLYTVKNLKIIVK